MKVVTPQDIISNFALVLELTDAQLAFIEEEPKRLYNLELMVDLQKSKGHNAHIVQLVLEKDIDITFCVHLLLKKYQSVSWVGRDHKFYIRRNITALFN